MNREEYLEFHKTLCNNARELSYKKNCDYAGKKGLEPFANFVRCEQMGITTTVKGMLVRMTDKFSRLSTFSESGSFEVADEKFEDTILDIINYSCLLAAYVKSHGPCDCGPNDCGDTDCERNS